MGFWIFCTAMVLLTPAVVLLFGRRFQTKPPKTINSLYGYRTTRSMKNQDTWDFAHRTCGRMWFKLGLALLPVSLLAMLTVLGWGTTLVGTACFVVVMIQMAVLVGSLFPVERALKKTFDDFGRKR